MQCACRCSVSQSGADWPGVCSMTVHKFRTSDDGMEESKCLGCRQAKVRAIGQAPKLLWVTGVSPPPPCLLARALSCPVPALSLPTGIHLLLSAQPWLPSLRASSWTPHVPSSFQASSATNTESSALYRYLEARCGVFQKCALEYPRRSSRDTIVRTKARCLHHTLLSQAMYPAKECSCSEVRLRPQGTRSKGAEEPC